MPTSNAYSLHDLTIGLTCPSTALQAKLQTLWLQLFQLAPGAQKPAIHFYFTDRPLPLPPQAVDGRVADELVYQTADLTVWRTGTDFHLQSAGARLQLDLVKCSARGHLSDSFWHCDLQDQREFFLLAFLILLHRQHRFGLHANGLIFEEKGYLVVGDSGRGKTTLALALMAQGWEFLGDDAVLLRASATGVLAQAFRRGFACTWDTIARFPELRGAQPARWSSGGNKWLLPRNLYAGQFRAYCTPQVLLFPTIVDRPCSRLLPQSQAQALYHLTRQSAGILTDAAIARQQLTVLTRLLQQVRCYQLQTGRDVFADRRSLADLLSRA